MTLVGYDFDLIDKIYINYLLFSRKSSSNLNSNFPFYINQ